MQLRRIVPIAVALSSVVALATFTAPAAQAAVPGTPGLLVGVKVLPNGGVTTSTENPDGSRLVQAVGFGGGTDQAATPTWSPDGKTIAAASGDGGFISYLPNLTGAQGTDAFAGQDATFTPDGKSIITSSRPGGAQAQLASMPSNWSSVQSAQPWFAASTGGADLSPTVSAKNGTVLFEHDANGATDIWTDHGNHTAGLLIANGQRPDLSPDGSTVAFVRSVNGFSQLFTQAADGTGTATQLTTGSTNHTYPKWTPDGLGLYYNAAPGTDYQTVVGHHLVLAGQVDTVTPNGLAWVTQQPIGPAPTTGSTFHSVTPTRILDSQAGTGLLAAGAVPAGGTIPLQIGGAAGIPMSGVTAVVLNVTVTGTTGPGHLTVWGDASAMPGTSNLNWDQAGQTISNLATVYVPSDGEVDLHTNSTTQILADVQGYYTADTSGAGYYGYNPTRILDTRGPSPVGTTQAGPVSYNTISLKVTGQGGVPANATAVALNLTTASTTSTAGYLEAYPEGTAEPGTSNVNWSSAGTYLTGQAMVPIGADGNISIKVHGTTDVVADVVGYFAPGGRSYWASPTPTRVLDSRVTGGKLPAGGGRQLKLGSMDGGSSRVVLNITVTDTTSAGFLTASADGNPVGNGSDINWSAGQTVANQVILPISFDGFATLYVNSSADVIVDVEGSY